MSSLNEMGVSVVDSPDNDGDEDSPEEDRAAGNLSCLISGYPLAPTV